MTTDITELAQRVKTEASAIDDTQWYLAKPSEISLLVEALEKAQQRIAELEDAEQKLCAANVTLDARAELAERQLQSRTVKLPEPFKLAKSSSGLTYYYADEVNEVLTAQGIKWEAE